MRRRNNPPQEMKGRWLLSFNDMMTLLFAFFVLIISMSNLETTKVQGISRAMKKVFGRDEAPAGAKIGIIEPFTIPVHDNDIQKARVNSALKQDQIDVETKKTAVLAAFQQMEGVSVLSVRNGFSLSFDEGIFFSPGSAEITHTGGPVLKNLGAILQRIDVSIRVEEYTNEAFTPSGSSSSRGDLSTVRAVNVVHYLITYCGLAPERFSAIGYGNVQSKRSSHTPEKRTSSRRVDIILTSSAT